MQRVGSVSFARLPRIALHGWNVCIRAKSTSSTDGYRAVAHISLGALTHNMDVLQRAAGMGHPLWPAVKANAYGHGAVHVARHLVSMGYSTMCVAYVAEALELLEAGVGAKKILVLAGMLGEEAKDILAWSGVVEPVISSPDTLQIVARLARDAGVSLGVHLMVDTGMSRQGCLPHQYGSLIKDAMALSPVIQIRGFMTHFACADDHDRAFTNLQIARFQEATASLPRGIARHAANSAAIFQFPEAHFDACRPGVSIYGMLPGPGVTNPLAAGLRPVLSLHARVTCVKTLPRGVGVSYSHSFVTKRDSTSIAVLPLGYGDGIPRSQTNKMHVMIKGTRCPQVGNVTMDQVVVDASNVPGGVSVGTLATVIGEGITADDLAQTGKTINYEVTTQISKRVHREVVP